MENRMTDVTDDVKWR